MENEKRVRLTRREFLALTALGGAGAMLTACGAPVTQAPSGGPSPAATVPATTVPATAVPPAVSGPKPGGTTVWGSDTFVNGLNPHTIPEGGIYTPNEHTYEGLTMFDDKLNIVPLLAESWETPDDKTYVFHLRKGVKFHDGTELTADDVKYTFDWVLDTSHPVYWRANFDQVDHVEAVDKYTAKFVCKTPFPPLLAALAAGKNSIIVKRGAIDDPKTSSSSNGTGPYKLADYMEKNQARLVKHADYWGKPKPYMDQVTWKLLLDEDARIAGLRGGSLDYAIVTAQGAKRLQGEKGINIVSIPSVYIISLEINMNRKPFDDPRVRQALSLAVDRQEIIDKAMVGAGTLTGPVATGMGKFFIPPDELKAKYYTPDPAKAKALLKEANFPFDKVFDYMWAPWGDLYEPVTIVIADQLKRVGVNVKLRQVETGIFSKEENPPVINFDMCTTAFSPRHDPDGYLWQRFESLGGTNPFTNGYRNDRLDDLLLKGRSTIDPAKRVDYYMQAQRIMLDENPQLWLFVRTTFHAYRDRVHNFMTNALDRRVLALLNGYLDP